MVRTDLEEEETQDCPSTMGMATVSIRACKVMGMGTGLIVEGLETGMELGLGLERRTD